MAFRWSILLSLLAAPAAAQESAPASTARVVYLTRDWLFIDAGWGEGLRRGSEIEVVRGDRTIAVLRVETVGDRRASCSILNRQGVLMLGDTVRLTPAAPRPKPAVAVAARPAPAAPAPASATVATPGPAAVPPPAPAPTPTPTPAVAPPPPSPVPRPPSPVPR